ncbi:protein kinase [Geodermatophilus sp. DSM 45219]|uniref:protein kinase domain-containing protein n=1 Tax=Geodermatophilus sp. DSM 45219 TaxID=1881103 RepID=UPI00088EFF65|nr:protein kinase [Geodermatophilus sp. DSM 45219]SDO04905.1 serine/threonine protein kinase [Geodermatophilus sp. DSM 45219]
MTLSTGTMLAGRYEITAPIATGGMGEVWRARDRVLDREVAAKVLRSEFTGDPSFVARFRNEARHTAALSHPNIASVYDYGETEDERGSQLAFLVMELVEGKPLVTILHEEGTLPVDWTLHVLGQSADGLSAAHHAGVVHRDIKPGNLIVRPDGVVKLTDFGIARARDATPLTRTGMVVGTAQYLSPEQAQGFEVTAASDVYSLGVVGYECLTGGRPFDGTSQVAVALAHINRPPPPLPASIPPAVRLLIERALAKDPADRFPDGAAFAAAIRSVASGQGLAPSSVPGPGTSPPVGLGAAGLGTAQTEVVGDLADSRTQVLGAASTAGPATGARTSVGALPPLRRTDDDDDRYAAAAATDDAPRRNRWVWLVAGLVLLTLLGTGLWFAFSGDGEDPAGTDADAGATTSAAPSASASAAGVLVDTSAYVGRPADEVEAELEAAGLEVEVEDADEADVAALGIELSEDDVVTTDPSEVSVAPGTTVTLFVAPDDFVPDTGEEAPAEETQEAPTAPTTQAPAPPTPSAPAPGGGGGGGGGGGTGNEGDGDTGTGQDPGTDTGQDAERSPGPDPDQAPDELEGSTAPSASTSPTATATATPSAGAAGQAP